jgi:hypothetical protein
VGRSQCLAQAYTERYLERVRGSFGAKEGGVRCRDERYIDTNVPARTDPLPQRAPSAAGTVILRLCVPRLRRMGINLAPAPPRSYQACEPSPVLFNSTLLDHCCFAMASQRLNTDAVAQRRARQWWRLLPSRGLPRRLAEAPAPDRDPPGRTRWDGSKPNSAVEERLS